VRTPGMFAEPLRRPSRIPRSGAPVQVTFPQHVFAHLPVQEDGRLTTLESFDYSTYAICCAKWELSDDPGAEQPEHQEIRYTPGEICEWLGINPDSGGNLTLVKESMARLGAITWDVPRTSKDHGEHRLQFQLLERHRYDPEARWGTFELPEPVTSAIRSGAMTRFPREALNALRREASPTAVFLYGTLLTHRGWEGSHTGYLEFRMSVDKLQPLVNRTDTNQSRLRRDLLAAAEAICRFDHSFEAPSLTKTGRGRWVFRVLKARRPDTAPRLRAADQPVREAPPHAAPASEPDPSSVPDHDREVDFLKALEESDLPDHVRRGIVDSYRRAREA